MRFRSANCLGLLLTMQHTPNPGAIARAAARSPGGIQENDEEIASDVASLGVSLGAA